MSKLYVHHNLTAIESVSAFGGGGGGGGSSSGLRKYGRPTSISEVSGPNNGKEQSSKCLADAAGAGVLAGGALAANPPLAATVGTAVFTGYVVTGQGDCVQ